jgi:hypothetical protein
MARFLIYLKRLIQSVLLNVDVLRAIVRLSTVNAFELVKPVVTSVRAKVAEIKELEKVSLKNNLKSFVNALKVDV